jgi:hypothetical protein
VILISLVRLDSEVLHGDVRRMTEFLGLAYAAYSYMYNVWLRIMVKGVKNNSYTMGDKVNQ